MQYGLTEENILLLNAIFGKYNAVKEVVLYGSRAKGNYTNRSDIDLVIKGSKTDRHIIANILLDFDDSNIPYLIDLQDISNIRNIQLIEHISRVGKVLYKRD